MSLVDFSAAGVVAAAVIIVLGLVAFVWGRNCRRDISEEHASQIFTASPYGFARGEDSRREETMGTCV